jgi:hypothetical protein
MDAVDRIANDRTKAAGGLDSLPVASVVIKGVTVKTGM